MQAVVLAGGVGARLRPLTYAIPKPLIAVGGRPIIELILEQLKASGVEEVFLATGYRAELIEAYIKDGARFGLKVSYSHEESPMGTAGPLKLLEGKLNQSVLVINGDTLTDLNFNTMLEHHLESGAMMTIGTQVHETTIPYGVLLVDDQGCVQSITEKPTITNVAMMGIYIVEPSVAELIEPGTPFNMPDLVNRLVERGDKVMNFPVKAKWMDLSTFRDYQRVNEEVSSFLDGAGENP